MPPAARISDKHTCPLSSSGIFPVPHEGGPIIGPSEPTVIIGGMPAAVQGDAALCVGDTDSIVIGSSTVLIGGKPAARVGDSTAHGGQIISGCVTVLING